MIFYNGSQEQPERKILRLSDAYCVKEEHPALELTAVMLNINRGHNEKLKEMCKSLKDYSEYTARVREYAQVKPVEEAVEQAIRECIQEGILSEFLKQNRAEAKQVSIYEYDEEKHMRQEREASWEEGREVGREEGREEGIKKGKTDADKSNAFEVRALKKENEYQVQLLSNKCERLESDLVAIKAEKAEIQAKLDDAYSQMRDLAARTVESTGGVKILNGANGNNTTK